MANNREKTFPDLKQVSEFKKSTIDKLLDRPMSSRLVMAGQFHDKAYEVPVGLKAALKVSSWLAKNGHGSQLLCQSVFASLLAHLRPSIIELAFAMTVFLKNECHTVNKSVSLKKLIITLIITVETLRQSSLEEDTISKITGKLLSMKEFYLMRKELQENCRSAFRCSMYDIATATLVFVDSEHGVPGIDQAMDIWKDGSINGADQQVPEIEELM